MDLKNINSIQLVKFMLIGLSGVVVNFIILHISLYLLSEQISVLLAIYISMSTNYIFNRIWTFKSKGKIIPEYVKYLTSSAIGALIQYLITIYLAIYLRSIDLDKLSLPLVDIPILYVTTLVGVGFGFIANFLLSKKFVFI